MDIIGRGVSCIGRRHCRLVTQAIKEFFDLCASRLAFVQGSLRLDLNCFGMRSYLTAYYLLV